MIHILVFALECTSHASASELYTCPSHVWKKNIYLYIYLNIYLYIYCIYIVYNLFVEYWQPDFCFSSVLRTILGT